MSYDRYNLNDPQPLRTKRKISKCPCCDGRGTVIDKNTRQPRTCLICNGAKEIETVRQMQ